jgi:thiamine transporter ThiT
MTTSTVKLYAFGLTNARTYIFAVIFILGNLLLPQLIHGIPQGGFIFLPIYFFTLIAAYKYGVYAGLLTGIFSPVINYVLFGMPPAHVLPAILVKSVILAIAAAFAARYFRKVSIVGVLLAILTYQIIGTGIEWLLVKDFATAVQDFRLGVPGLLIQLFGGFLVLKAIEKV